MEAVLGMAVLGMAVLGMAVSGMAVSGMVVSDMAVLATALEASVPASVLGLDWATHCLMTMTMMTTMIMRIGTKILTNKKVA
ncbi:MAG TPA: hypothetical protein VGL27_00325 [Negativicutes bacterium]